MTILDVLFIASITTLAAFSVLCFKVARWLERAGK